jgi:hypothetical protein
LPRESGRWNFGLHPVRKSSRTVEVAPARDEDVSDLSPLLFHFVKMLQRYGIAPETDAEAAAAMQRTNSNEANNSTQPGQRVVGAQGSQVQPIPTQAQVSTGIPEDIVCGVSCCGTFFGFRRPASHRS